MLYLMVKHQEADLDAVFAALSHAARRQTLDALGRGAASVSDLAAPHGMSLSGFMKHVKALESAGLIECAKEGRTVTCALARKPLRNASDWLASRERLWSARMDALGRHLYHREQVSPPRKSRKE
ncbi:MAG: metalloregulator ArsR/SmtB family transcription factor [Caldimonas sp.]